MFTVSSVTGKDTDLLLKFLNVLPPLHSTKEREQFMQELTEHQVHLQLVLGIPQLPLSGQWSAFFWHLITCFLTLWSCV